MLFLKYILATWLLFATVTNAQSDQGSMISYNVIALLNQTTFKSMAVIVDSISYPLEANKTFPVLFSGKAPSAKSGYHYAKVYVSDNSTLAEPFERQSVNQSTPHEFFNRTWNTHDNAQLPQVYSPLNSIHRIKSDLHRDNEIPTIHIIGNQTELDQLKGNVTEDISAKTTISYLSLHDALQFENVELSLSGNSAKLLPKSSYNLKLHKKDGLYGYRNLKLRSLGFDPSYIREQLGYDLLKSAGLISSEFSFVRVFMNDQELGLYGIIDTFKGPWFSDVFADGDSSYKNGYLYQSKAVGANNHTADLSYYENITAYADGQYKIKEEATGGEKDNYKPLMDLTKFIAEAPTNGSDAVNEWNKRFDMDSVVRSLVIEILGGYADGYLSNLNNYYLYQSPDSGQYLYIAADLDFCLGATVVNITNLWTGNYNTFPGWGERPLADQMMRVPEFNQKFKQLLQELNTKLFNPDVMNPRINDLANMIREDVVWDHALNDPILRSFFDYMGASDGPDGLKVPGFTAVLNADPTVSDIIKRLFYGVSFDVALNGPTGHISLSGLKEWFSVIHQNTANFFSQQ
ncbi:hypothetical protein G6F16_001644 [Rhizopus arrhizus]|uniref:CotH protein n=1 Tax=Rhizopus oryzae TaxID=64495 RepID=A0A9P7BXI9_RHIOR|nr:hypothetical protein G6F21_000030 [Rhizopus arrhizus]KAG0816288.1 hypothetical protein G6F20_003318 [Rhizopus arrhizus]KAG0837879.1 hypothetical protein G6F19_003452 [Rhizopus arrhizus]KAG0842112.1 hypothetical protein G6F18_002929 [Rhizopus arrhizus]KAG0859773.1 hypothetical protein G6F17_001595 [Rhizopus arrhizus]